MRTHQEFLRFADQHQNAPPKIYEAFVKFGVTTHAKSGELSLIIQGLAERKMLESIFKTDKVIHVGHFAAQNKAVVEQFLSAWGKLVSHPVEANESVAVLLKHIHGDFTEVLDNTAFVSYQMKDPSNRFAETTNGLKLASTHLNYDNLRALLHKVNPLAFRVFTSRAFQFLDGMRENKHLSNKQRQHLQAMVAFFLISDKKLVDDPADFVDFIVKNISPKFGEEIAFREILIETLASSNDNEKLGNQLLGLLGRVFYYNYHKEDASDDNLKNANEVWAIITSPQGVDPESDYLMAKSFFELANAEIPMRSLVTVNQLRSRALIHCYHVATSEDAEVNKRTKEKAIHLLNANVDGPNNEARHAKKEDKAHKKNYVKMLVELQGLLIQDLSNLNEPQTKMSEHLTHSFFTSTARAGLEATFKELHEAYVEEKDGEKSREMLLNILENISAAALPYINNPDSHYVRLLKDLKCTANELLKMSLGVELSSKKSLSS